MANAAVISATNRLGHAMKTLKEQWDITGETWNDRVRHEFEDRYLTPIETAVNSAVDGMHELSEVLDKVRRDCSDRNESW